MCEHSLRRRRRHILNEHFLLSRPDFRQHIPQAVRTFFVFCLVVYRMQKASRTNAAGLYNQTFNNKKSMMYAPLFS